MSYFVIFGRRYSIVQKNGQKIITNLDYCENPFDAVKFLEKKELYLSGIPRRFSEIQLIEIFASIGAVQLLRIMVNFSGENKGFGYLIYEDDADFNRAFLLLHGKKFENYRVLLRESQNHRKLICIFWDEILINSGIIEYLRENFKLVHYGCNRQGNRFEIILTFLSHRDAALARRWLCEILMSAGNFNNSRICVKWYY